MSQPVSPRLQQAVEMVKALSPDEQRQLLEIIRQRLIQYQRAELVAEVAEARQAYRQGPVQRGTVADLMKSLESDAQTTVVRTSRGLVIAGTRITLYDILDYLAADWPPDLIRDWFDLSDRQIADVMDYIEKNRVQVEAEYRLILQETEEIRRYWEARNRERFAQIAITPPKPGQEEIRAKLAAWKARLEPA
jgi:uncharacterized protein (DUF433 family)